MNHLERYYVRSNVPIIPMMVDFEVQNCTTTGVFDDPLEFTCRHWRRTQHIIYEFWT